jgi:predicted Fe-Mo cluster-binding NifX family protein
MGQTIAGIPVAGTPVAGMPVGGMPETIPPMGQTSAGMPVGGMPETIPPMGQTTAAILVGGQPETIPPMGQSGAAVLTADTVSAVTVAGMPVGGMPETIPPMGQTTAAILVGGQPETIPPMGQSGAAILTADTVSAVTVAGKFSEKICIAAQGATLDSPVSPLFERAPYFLIVGLGSFEALANPNINDRLSVGEQSAQLVVGEGASVVLTNDIGIKAMEELNKLQVKVYTGVKGTAQQALEWYQAGRLVATQLTTIPDTSASSDHSDEERGPPESSTGKAKAKGENSTTTL